MRKVYLYITPTFPSPDCWRGAYSLDFVKALMAVGRYSVEVFVPGRGGDCEIDGVKVHRFAEKRLPSALFPFLFARTNLRSFLAALEKAGVRLADVAVCHANTAAYAGYAAGLKALDGEIRAVLHHHCCASFGLNIGILRHVWLYNMVEFPILRRYHEKMDLHVFVSEAARRSFLMAPDASWTDDADYKAQMRWLPYRPPRVRNTCVLHNGVDMDVFCPKIDEGRKSEGLDKSFVIGCVGNFLPSKGQMVLLKAVELVEKGYSRVERAETCRKAVRIVFVGSGAKRGECERFAKEHGIDVEFRNEVRHEELANFYRELDLFVLPSSFEGFGCVYTEAYACGTPFIGVKGQGIAEVTTDDWLIEPGDVEGLASKILMVVSDRRSQQMTAEIDIKSLVKRYIAALENAL